MRNTSSITEYKSNSQSNSPTRLGLAAKQPPMNISLPPPFVRHSKLDNSPAMSKFHDHGGATYADHMSISHSKPIVVPPPGPGMSRIIEPSAGSTYAGQMHPQVSGSVEISHTTNVGSNSEHRRGSTYADIMDRMKSKIQNDIPLPKPESMISSKESAPKPVIPASQKLEASQYIP
jgi:hypothetical protein